METVTDLEPCILDGASHPMIGASPPERYEMCSWFEDTENLGPQFHVVCDPTGIPAVPLVSNLIGRVANTGIKVVVREIPEDITGIPVQYL